VPPLEYHLLYVLAMKPLESFLQVRKSHFLEIIYFLRFNPPIIYSTHIFSQATAQTLSKG
jgi:hypothetical protein